MFLENLAVDAVDPLRLGRFWEAALGTTTLTASDELFETRLQLTEAFYLDLCFIRVPLAPAGSDTAEPRRLHPDLLGGAQQTRTAQRLRELGAEDLDIGQQGVPWIVLGDVEGNPFCVMEEREAYTDTGPIAALPLDSADPQRDAEFWAWLTGWTDVHGQAPRSLRQPSRRGPLLELCPEIAPKGTAKNRMHLDVRLEPGEDLDEVTAGIRDRGGRVLDHDWGELPWRVHQDPSGNEFCVLPAPGASA